VLSDGSEVPFAVLARGVAALRHAYTTLLEIIGADHAVEAPEKHRANDQNEVGPDNQAENDADKLVRYTPAGYLDPWS
jgi:hypothetical protein